MDHSPVNVDWSPVNVIWLVRHGQTQWSLDGRHTGLTEVPLTEEGQEQARALRPRIAHLLPGLVLSSPLQRAQQTALLAGISVDEVTDDLHEWDYGAWEGRTTPEIRVALDQPDWLIWDTPVPAGKTPGEQPDDVGARADRVIEQCLPVLASGQDCMIVAHGHVLRILTARWLGLPATDGRHFALDPATLSALGFEHDTRVITTWNSR